MYDSRTARPLAVHRFTVPHPLPPQGNRYGLDAIYIPASGSQLIHIVPQLVYHGIGLPILGSDTWNNEALRMKPEAVSLPAHFTVGFWPELDTQQTQAFTRRYQERFASPPDALAASAYDAARLLMTAILRSDGTREGLRAALSGIGSFDGLTGIMRMTPQREVEKTAVVLKIERGDVTPAR
jgi:branched-chain amino acid transport system substrate-binding protein